MSEPSGPRGRRGTQSAGAAAGASTAALLELWTLVRATARLWRRTFWVAGAWFCLGSAVHTLGLLASARLGAEHGALALVAFVVGVVATLVALVLMIHSMEPHLRTASTAPPAADALTGLRVPGQVFVRERAVVVVASAVGPFLAVYAVWGFVDDQVRELFQSNYAVQGLGGVLNFSINLSADRWRFFAVAAAAAWVAKEVLAVLTAHGRRRGLALLGVLAEALWVFSLFAVAIIATRAALGWLRTRAAWVGLQDGWQGVLGLLPDWHLPFGLTVPQALDGAVDLLVGTVVPGAWTAVALPLVWLALTATVLGWREFGGSDALAGTRLEEPAARLVLGRRTRVLAALATDDLRTKYLPVLQALRLVARAGPRFVGVYLVLATVLTAAQGAFDIAVTVLVGPRGADTALLVDPFAVLVSGLVFTPVAIALYASAFDEALTAALRRTSPSEAPVTAAPPAGSGRRPATAASAPGRRSGPG